MNKDELIKVNANTAQKQVRVAEAVRLGMSLSAYMLMTSDPDRRKPSNEQFLSDICMRERQRIELEKLAVAISKTSLSPIDARMILQQLARMEERLKSPSGSNQDGAS